MNSKKCCNTGTLKQAFLFKANAIRKRTKNKSQVRLVTLIRFQSQDTRMDSHTKNKTYPHHYWLFIDVIKNEERKPSD